jgi:hypothetical protein
MFLAFALRPLKHRLVKFPWPILIPESGAFHPVQAMVQAQSTGV